MAEIPKIKRLNRLVSGDARREAADFLAGYPEVQLSDQAITVRICKRCHRPLAQHTDYCRAYGRPDVWDDVEMVPLAAALSTTRDEGGDA